ncbi:DUF2975 domain-containing protein [Lacihabitans sp. LS3-19]|uniref:DUF2975 domain-containing protein n=1 Tax=Lacihabitans sp. LS3-19 TaxID=2487335 RepID=UPI0020CCD715|nr:DUF2975 domain-containing protein [Lacihabitans sp. LS3-19]MCP9768230.1 DUF2975 domain-containing protein [Lacihabitans sp. LS3-19]
MSKSNRFVFIVLSIVAWAIFIGLCIEAGALIVNFIFSLLKPAFVHNLYQKLDLSKMYKKNEWVFYCMYSFILVISILKAVLFYIVVLLVTKIDMSKPFSSFASRQISLMSYFTLTIGLLSFIAKETAKSLAQNGYEIDKLNMFWEDSQAFIIMAAIIYVIANIFAKGVELQNENDLTI